jgi:hypothetical protein
MFLENLPKTLSGLKMKQNRRDSHFFAVVLLGSTPTPSPSDAKHLSYLSLSLSSGAKFDVIKKCVGLYKYIPLRFWIVLQVGSKPKNCIVMKLLKKERYF